jgi:hypothetical protein
MTFIGSCFSLELREEASAIDTELVGHDDTSCFASVFKASAVLPPLPAGITFGFPQRPGELRIAVYFDKVSRMGPQISFSLL